jgi:PAS domain S-box-containing protein
MKLIRDFRKEDVPWSEVRSASGILSGIHFPILYEGECIAHLSMHSSRPDAFSQEDVDLLGSVSDHLGLAIRNVKHHNEVQRKLTIFQSAIQDNRNAIILQNSNRTIVHWNSGAERIYGYTEEEVLGEKIDILFTPEDKVRTERGDPVFNQGESLDFEGERVRKDGSRIWVSVTLSPILNDEGDVLAISAVHKENSKNRSEEKLHGAISDTLNWFPMGVVLLDDSRRVIHANRIANEILRAEDGLLLIGEMIGATVEKDAEALAQLIYAVTNPDNVDDSADGTVISISRNSGLRSYSILVGRIRDHSLGQISQKTGTVLFISDPEMGHDSGANCR